MSLPSNLPTFQPSTAPSILLGVDAGGSHTTAAIARPDLTVLGRADGPGTPLRPGAAAATAATIAEVATRAARAAGIPLPADRAVVGAAGAGRAFERRELRDAIAAHGLARLLEVVAAVGPPVQGGDARELLRVRQRDLRLAVPLLHLRLRRVGPLVVFKVKLVLPDRHGGEILLLEPIEVGPRRSVLD